MSTNPTPPTRREAWEWRYRAEKAEVRVKELEAAMREAADELRAERVDGTCHMGTCHWPVVERVIRDTLPEALEQE